MYSNLAFCDIYPVSRALKEQLYRSLTPVSTAATLASAASSLDTSDSNHTYEPIETAQAMSEAYSNQAPLTELTLIHHDGRRVTANRIVSLDNLRDTLLQHDKVPYDDPESRGDLYILAPMRLLTPVLEESESDLTRSKTYQSLGSCFSNASRAYSDLDASIMSIISEVLNIRSDSGNPRTNPGPEPRDRTLAPIAEDAVDTCSLLHTIEEIRNSSLCNLYYSSNPDLSKPPVPRVPSRNTLGYESLIKENQESKASIRPGTLETLNHYRTGEFAEQETRKGSVEPVPRDLNDSIKSVHSNTLVVTPPTVRAKKPTPLNNKVGVRKNILNLVGSTNDILNTPKRVKIDTAEKLSLPKDTSTLSESIMSEQNEFKSLVPHLTSQGAKFLSKLKATAGTESEHETSQVLSPKSFNGDFSTFSDTPSPKLFVRNISNNKNHPRRKFSLLNQRFETEEENSDYKYGFMPEHPDAKYGFGVFGTETYNVVETAKLCSSLRESTPKVLSVPSNLSVGSISGVSSSYSLSVLNRGGTDFKLHPDQQYLQYSAHPANFHRNWVSTSLQRRPSKIGDRTDATRRSMSILDDFEEKENIGPRQREEPTKRRPLATVNKTSPMKILGSSVHSPQSRVYKLNPNVPRSTLPPKQKIFRNRCDT